LRCDKNVVLDVAFRSSGGRAFQAASPATVNASSAILVLVLTTAKFPRCLERSRSSLPTWHSSVKYRMELCHAKRHTSVSTACTALDWLWVTSGVDVAVVQSEIHADLSIINPMELSHQRRHIIIGQKIDSVNDVNKD